MDRSAPVDYDVHELIRQRHSPRVFADRIVEREVLHSLLEAARWAASSFNEQPWRFLVARREEGEEFHRLLKCLMPGNQAWADKAAVLVLSVASLRFARNNKPNRHAYHDVGLAAAQLTLEATARGLVVHQMAGFEVAKARETYGIPEEFDPVAAIALGYPADLNALPKEVQEKELTPRTPSAAARFRVRESLGSTLRRSVGHGSVPFGRRCSSRRLQLEPPAHDKAHRQGLVQHEPLG